MATPRENIESSPASGAVIHRVGVVVHPARDIDAPLRAVRRWTARHDAELVQITLPGRQRRVAEEGHAHECELLVSIGGDGTMLAATRAAMNANRPVLGVACGSLGVLTSVAVEGVASALERFERDDWVPRRLSALEVTRAEGDSFLALNDIAIVRAGQGQIRATATLDGTIFGRFAGDGCIVSTPIGSSAYALAAGGPLITPDVNAFLLTPLTVHGGFCPPLVISGRSRLQLETNPGRSGARVEVDGQVTDLQITTLRIELRADAGTVVTFGDQDSLLAGLRTRGIIADSPRIVADDGRL